MSLNHYSSDHHNTHPPEPTTATWQNENNNNDIKESLFEKTLTPSDVGKLNRLVIPKQHAEKYFPLNSSIISNNNGDTSSSEKGMLLSFEDEIGKCWRFRYSYWNSSQSYVLTKGWSRFVKDKHLDPGDVVFFQRLICSFHDSSPRFFIGWRRRGQVSSSSSVAAATNSTVDMTSYVSPPYLHSNYINIPPSHDQEYYHYGATVGTTAETHATPSSSAVIGSSKTVRLFGVNLECQMDEDDGAATTAVVDSHDGYYGQNMYYYYNTTHPGHNIMGNAVSRDETVEICIKINEID
ncbi:unnamed protein product [Cochlearia groenlandica]